MDHYFRGYEGGPFEPRSFPELVLGSVQRWREAKPSWHEASVAVELSFVSQWGFELARNNFPNYIPEDIQREVFRTHPVPITTGSILTDRRLHLEKGGKLQVKKIIPKGIEKSDEEAWKNGISIFDEIAAETLAQDILRKSRGESTSKPGNIKAENSAFSSGYVEIVKSFENRVLGDKLFNHFVRRLILAGMINDRTHLNNIVNLIGFESIDHFAVAIGRNHRYEGIDLKKNRLLYSYNNLGSYGMYPGIISLGFARESLNALFLGAGVLGSLLLGPLAPLGVVVNSAVAGYKSQEVLKQTARVWLHEAAHYLQSGTTNLCLTPVVWKLR